MSVDKKSPATSRAVWIGCLALMPLLANANWASADTSEDDPFLTLPIGSVKPDPVAAIRRVSAGVSAFHAIQADPEVQAHVKDGIRSLTQIQKIESTEIETTKFQDYYRGIEVLGSTVMHHRSKASGEAEISHLLSRFELSITPSVGESEAIGIAMSIVGDRNLKAKPVLKVLPDEEGDSAQLIYWVKIQAKGHEAGRDLLINAHTGQVIANLSHHMEIAPIDVYAADENCEEVDPMSGFPLSIDISACRHAVKAGKVQAGADASARRAANNSLAALRYYANKHGRDSFDGEGGRIVNIVHIGESFSNAFWDSERNIMAYGDGDGEEMGDFTLALDVAGHELTHGVTSNTANLIYMGQSGALNEAYSDFFGKMIAGENDWIVGKKLFLSAAKRRGLRNLANPGEFKVNFTDENGRKVQKPYPAHMSERFPIATDGACDRSNDNCWVHVNSTIPGHASYLVVESIGREKAEKLYYTVLTQYLNARSTFATAKSATLRACKQLFDAGTCSQVKEAFAEVGL